MIKETTDDGSIILLRKQKSIYGAYEGGGVGGFLKRRDHPQIGRR